MVSVCLSSDALSQHLPSYSGFSYLWRMVSPHGRPSWPWMWSSSSWPSRAHAAAAPWMCGCSSQSLIQFSVDGWSCVPSLLFTWGQTVVEVMKIMVASFKRSHACTATLGTPNPAAGHYWPTPLLETPGNSQASLGQSLVGSLLLSSGSWCTQGSVCSIQESVSQSCVSSGSSVRVRQLPPRGLRHTQGLWVLMLHPEALPLRQSTADPYLHRNTQTVLSRSLWGL